MSGPRFDEWKSIKRIKGLVCGWNHWRITTVEGKFQWLSSPLVIVLSWHEEGQHFFISPFHLTPSKMTRSDIQVPLVHLHPMIMWVLFHHVPNWKHLSQPQSQPDVALPQRKFQFRHSSVFVWASRWGLALVEALRPAIEIYCDFLISQGLPIDRDFHAHSRIVFTALRSLPTTTIYWKVPPPPPTEEMLLSSSLFCTFVCQSRSCW
jgi:hypothetical protein